jgi:hypothetical protein
MSTLDRFALPLALTLTLGPGGARAGELALERLIWSNPELSQLVLRTARLPGGGLSVHARAADRETERNAREWLATAAGVESFQVDFDPYLRSARRSDPDASSLEAAKTALREDAGTRLLAGLLDEASLDREGILTFPAPTGLDAGTERRLARLLLAQPGIQALRHESQGSPRPSPEEQGRPPRRAAATPRETGSETSPGSQGRRTRLELDPLQPEAVAIPRAPKIPRTRLHVDEAALTPSSSPATTPSRWPQPVPQRQESVTSVPIEETPSALATRQPEGSDHSDIDAVIADLLARTMALKGDTEGVEARVASGLVTMSGHVGSRELALELRELARNFDGIRRVTGSLQLADGETVPMDAVAD